MKKVPSFEALQLLQLLFDTKNLTAAALQLGMPVSTASTLLKELRTVFDDPLFTRVKEGLIPSQKAYAVRRRVLPVLASYHQLMASERFVLSEVDRTVKISCVDNAPYALFPNLIAEVVRQAPKAVVEFFPLMSGTNMLERLRRGEIDMVVSPLLEASQSGYHSAVLCQYDYALVGRREHPLARTVAERAVPASDTEVGSYSFIDIGLGTTLTQRTSTIREHAFPAWKGFRSSMVSPFFLPFYRSLEDSDLLMVLPRRTAEQLTEAHRLAIIPVRSRSVAENPRLIWHDCTDKDPFLQWLRALAVHCASTPVA